ncbi:hypothetical protein EAF00_007875 [Botryotinia globosa]|nr:hypothetical protein EAF00_007875 [Botryotinia globosa]
MKLTLLISLVGLTHGSVLLPRTTSSNISASDYNNLTFVLLQQTDPCYCSIRAGLVLNLNATVAKETTGNDANLIVFPELWFPGYPKGMTDHITIADHLQSYVNNSLVVGSPQWQAILEMIKSESIYAVLGFSHKEDGLL